MWKWVVVAICVVACRSSPHKIGDGGGPTGDSPAVDSPVIDSRPADASLDAPPDAPPDASDPMRVWVKVNDLLGDGLPDPNAYVIFMDPSGAVVQDVNVDANGEVSIDLPTGGTVTVVQKTTIGNILYEYLTTYRGVKGGDSIRSGDAKQPNINGGATQQMTAHMPLDAYNGTLYFECGNGGSSFPPNGIQSLAFYDSCRTPTFDILMTAYMSNTLEFVWQPGLTFADHGDVNVADNFQLMGQGTLTVSNPPPGLASVAMWFYTVVDGMQINFDMSSAGSPTGPVTFMYRYPPGAGTSSLISIRENPGDVFGLVTTGSPASTAIDLASLPLPKISTKPTQTLTTVSWTQTNAGSPDARYVQWVGHWFDSSINMTRQVSWGIVEDPSGPTTSALMPLPAGHTADDPTQQATVTLNFATVSYVDYDNLAGYDAARRWGPSLADPTINFLGVSHLGHVTGSP